MPRGVERPYERAKFAAMVREWRQALTWTLRGLASKAGVSSWTLSGIEKLQRRASPDECRKLIEALTKGAEEAGIPIDRGHFEKVAGLQSGSLQDQTPGSLTRRDFLLTTVAATTSALLSRGVFPEDSGPVRAGANPTRIAVSDQLYQQRPTSMGELEQARIANLLGEWQLAENLYYTAAFWAERRQDWRAWANCLIHRTYAVALR